jgi:hypothetical protein
VHGPAFECHPPADGLAIGDNCSSLVPGAGSPKTRRPGRNPTQCDRPRPRASSSVRYRCRKAAQR